MLPAGVMDVIVLGAAQVAARRPGARHPVHVEPWRAAARRGLRPVNRTGRARPDGGHPRARLTFRFIPAKATDNPYLDEAYFRRLDTIKDPARRAMACPAL